MNVLTKNKPGRKAKKRKEREKVMRSYMEGKKYRENKGESAIMEKMKKYIKFARGKIFFSFYEEKRRRPGNSAGMSPLDKIRA